MGAPTDHPAQGRTGIRWDTSHRGPSRREHRPTARQWPATLGWIVLLPMLLSLGCGGGGDGALSESVVSHDLLTELAVAESVGETTEVVFGTPEGRRRLGTGWSIDELEAGSGQTFVWGVGEVSRLELPLFVLQGRRLVLECRPLARPGAEPQAITIELGGVEVGTLELQPGRKRYTLDLPPERLVLGRNTLALRYRWHRPADEFPLGSNDRRALAVAFFRLTVEGAEPPDSPQADLERQRLFVPPGNELAFYLELAEGSRWVSDGASFRGGARLAVTVDGEGGAPPWSVTLEDFPAEGLALPTAGLARLVVQVLGPAGSGVALTGPRIVHPPARATTLTAASVSAASVPAASMPESTVEPLRRDPAAGPVVEHLVLYLVDTLRADHVGAYGHPGGLTPEIDAFAREAVLFEHAISQSSWTRASVVSILSGQGPLAHGTNRRNHLLADSLPVLQEILAEAGFATAAFVSNPNLAAEFGFDRGFEVFEDVGGTETDGTVVVERVDAWFERREAEGDTRPFFLLVHTIDPHSPYDPPADLRARFAAEVPAGLVFEPTHRARHLRNPAPGALTLDHALALYAAEVAANDRAFGALRRVLTTRGVAATTGLLLLSDHGEEFLEHGNLEHGKELFDESLRVPFVLQLGEATVPSRQPAVVQHLDVLPTLLEAVGLEAPGSLPGRSLVPSVIAGSTGTTLDLRPIVTYLHLDGDPRISLRQGRWKLIYRLDDTEWLRPRLFDLVTDPGERTNLAEEQPIRLGVMRAFLQHHQLAGGAGAAAPTTEIDSRLRERLEALGYL